MSRNAHACSAVIGSMHCDCKQDDCLHKLHANKYIATMVLLRDPGNLVSSSGWGYEHFRDFSPHLQPTKSPEPSRSRRTATANSNLFAFNASKVSCCWRQPGFHTHCHDNLGNVDDGERPGHVLDGCLHPFAMCEAHRWDCQV